MAPQKPSIGRVVHYHSYGTPSGEYLPEPRAAIVTAVHPDLDDLTDHLNHKPPYVSLCVLNPTGMFFDQAVAYSEEPKPGHWSWPERV